ncbi:MAG: hypothetical protein ACLFTT_16665 [Candidatus Hydrogenedentota bacterium]
MSALTVGVVAGSGMDLAAILDHVEAARDFAHLGMGGAAVDGHAGRFLIGRCGGRRVVLQHGRCHVYEGRDAIELLAPLNFMAEQGVSVLILTNAAGALLPELRPGDLVGASEVQPQPCRRIALPERLHPDFVLPNCNSTGPYIWVHGPTYETRAEIALLRRLGGAAVGMSAAPELHHAQNLGMRAGVVSCITNNCCRPTKLTHEHVVHTAALTSRRLVALLRTAVLRGV